MKNTNDDLKSLTTMLEALRSFNILSEYYMIKSKEVLTDKGLEFGKKSIRNKVNNPFNAC